MSAWHTAGVVSRLRTTPIPVGDARKPAGAGWQGSPGGSQFVTYLVVYPIGSQRDGPDASLADNADAPVNRFQVNAVGRDRTSVETAADLAAAVLLNRQRFDIPDWDTVTMKHENSVGVTVDETVSPPVFIAIDRYRLDTSPS